MVWCTNSKDIAGCGGELYCCSILDLFGRIGGWNAKQIVADLCKIKSTLFPNGCERRSAGELTNTVTEGTYRVRDIVGACVNSQSDMGGYKKKYGRKELHFKDRRGEFMFA